MIEISVVPFIVQLFRRNCLEVAFDVIFSIYLQVAKTESQFDRVTEHRVLAYSVGFDANLNIQSG